MRNTGLEDSCPRTMRRCQTVLQPEKVHNLHLPCFYSVWVWAIHSLLYCIALSTAVIYSWSAQQSESAVEVKLKPQTRLQATAAAVLRVTDSWDAGTDF